MPRGEINYAFAYAAGVYSVDMRRVGGDKRVSSACVRISFRAMPVFLLGFEWVR
ncbi:MAG: hypothetical protein PSN37_03555 [Alphaproteobacteria bacterium]|nr:hypothetical protein [Alphaproteobacteria bacterium]